MKRNALVPFLMIMVFGIGLIFALSLIGNTDDRQASGGKNGGNSIALTPEEIYSQSCYQCHGENYEGGAGPELVGVGDRLSAEEIRDVLVNGRGIMQGGLVPEGNLDEMVDWLMTLK